MLFCVAACRTSYFVEETGRAWNRAADSSSSPLSEKDVVAIAKVVISKREHWPESKRDPKGLIHTVCYGARRINDGGWVVIAHRGVVESGPNSCGDCVYDPIPAAIIFINKKGDVTRYSRQYVMHN